jgi:hypothetical protein
MIGKLIGVAILVAIGFGVYKIGHAVTGESSSVQTVVVGIPNKAAATVAEANLAQAASGASTYYGEHDSYSGFTTASLYALVPGLSGSIQVKSADATSYCLEDDLRGQTAHLVGPSGTASAGPCP